MEQLSLLALAAPRNDNTVAPISVVPGLAIHAEFISAAEELRLLELIDASEWSNELRRRVQHYGYRYDYRKRGISQDDYIGPLPRWAVALGKRLTGAAGFTSLPDQVIVNEYLPGQGIAPHIDRPSCFGPVVASISLGSAVMMEYRRERAAVDVPLLPRCMATMTGPARYEWRHSIAARAADPGLGPRSRRISLTFRTTLFDE